MSEPASLNEPSVSRQENDPAAVAALPHALRDMQAHSGWYPPREGWRARPAFNVHLHPHVRFRIEPAQAVDIGYGMWREDALSELGVSGAELDSRAFAKGLMDALGGHLSIRNLEHLRTAIDQQLAEHLAMRDCAVEKIEALKES